jgi:hypothetical protein
MLTLIGIHYSKYSNNLMFNKKIIMVSKLILEYIFQLLVYYHLVYNDTE